MLCAGALQCLLEQRDERQRLGRAGRRRVLEHFTMRHIAAQTVEIYKAMIPSLAQGEKWHTTR